VVFAKACELRLEGIVSKREGSFYKSGPSRNWLKTKNPETGRYNVEHRVRALMAAASDPAVVLSVAGGIVRIAVCDGAGAM
jgi:hypothetical protein